MERHLTDRQLQDYGEQSLSPSAFLRAHEHLEACQECRRRLDTMFSKLIETDDAALVEGLRQDVIREFHLNYDEHLRPFVFGTIDDLEKEIVESHAEVCEACRGDLSDLLRFHRELEQEREIRKLNAAGWLARLGEWFNSAGKRSILISAAALILAAAGIAAVVVWRSNPGVLNTAVSTNNGGFEIPAEAGAVPPADSVTPKIPESDPIDLATVVLPDFLKSLQTVDETVRGNAEIRSITIVSPNGLAIRDRTPLLVWKKDATLDAFDVAVFDAELNRVAGADGIKSNSWNSPTLVPGRLYNWQVAALGGGSTRSIGQGRFYVVSNEALAKIDAAKAGAERAKALAEAGLLNEAAIEIRSLLKVDPSYAGARRLLARIQSAGK